MQYDIADILRSTLNKMGYPAGKHQFDAHSTIEIKLENIPSLFISIIDERAWLWSRLTWMDSDTVSTWGGELLQELQEVLPWIVTGQPVLGHGEEGYELKGLIDDACFEAEERLEMLLENFFLLCVRLQDRFSRLG